MQGWGTTGQGKSTNDKWSSQESTRHINFLELKAAFLVLKTFLKGQSHKVVLLKMDNSSAVAYINSSSDVLNSGDLELVSSQRHPHFCTACPWKRKCHRRPRVSYHPRFQRLATWPKGNHTLPYKLQHRSVCQLPNSSTISIHQLETRSRSISYRCPNSTLEFSEGLCLSPFQPHSSSSQQGNSGQYRSSACSTNMWPFTQKRALMSFRYMGETNGHWTGCKQVTKPFEMVSMSVRTGD